MKSYAAVAVLVLLAVAFVAANEKQQTHMVGSSYGGSSGGASSYGGSSGGSSYGGGASIPAPPCPKNYLFSCQPNLSPAPCSQSSGGYGSSGSYSENYPVYAVPNPVPYYGFY